MGVQLDPARNTCLPLEDHGQLWPVSIHVTTHEAHFPVTRSISKPFQRIQGSNRNLPHRSRSSARAFNQRAILMILLAPLRTQPERAALPRQIPPDPVALWPASGTMPGATPSPPCSPPPAPRSSAWWWTSKASTKPSTSKTSPTAAPSPTKSAPAATAPKAPPAGP